MNYVYVTLYIFFIYNVISYNQNLDELVTTNVEEENSGFYELSEQAI